MKVIYNIVTDLPLGPIAGAWKEFETSHFPPSKDFNVRITIPPNKRGEKDSYSNFSIAYQEEGMVFCPEENGEEWVNFELVPFEYYTKRDGTFSQSSYEEFCNDMVALCKQKGWKLIVCSKEELSEELRVLCE
jgi:hypothetical protein